MEKLDISNNSNEPDNSGDSGRDENPIKVPRNLNISEWDTSSENIVKEIAENCQGYKFMHYLNSRHYSRINNICMYIGIILCPLAGTLSAINVYFNHTQISIYFSIAIAFITYIAALKISIVKFGRYNEKSNLHEQSSKRYAQLENNSRVQLTLNRKNRINVRIYLNWLTKIYDEIYQGSPIINSWVYKKYMKQVETSGIIFPGKYDSIIRINNEEHKDYKDIESQKNSGISSVPLREFSEAQMNYEINRLMGI